MFLTFLFFSWFIYLGPSICYGAWCRCYSTWNTAHGVALTQNTCVSCKKDKMLVNWVDILLEWHNFLAPAKSFYTSLYRSVDYTFSDKWKVWRIYNLFKPFSSHKTDILKCFREGVGYTTIVLNCKVFSYFYY